MPSVSWLTQFLVLGPCKGSSLRPSWIFLLQCSWGVFSINFTVFSPHCLILGSKMMGLGRGFLTDLIWPFFLIQFPSCKKQQTNTSVSPSSDLQAASEASVNSTSPISNCRRNSSISGHSKGHAPDTTASLQSQPFATFRNCNLVFTLADVSRTSRCGWWGHLS